MSKGTIRIGDAEPEREVTLIPSTHAVLRGSAGEAFVPVRVLGADYEAKPNGKKTSDGYTRTGFHATMRLTADEADKLGDALKRAAHDARTSLRSLMDEDDES